MERIVRWDTRDCSRGLQCTCRRISALLSVDWSVVVQLTTAADGVGGAGSCMVRITALVMRLELIKHWAGVILTRS